MSERIVICSKLNKEAPGLDAPPFGGALGSEIYEKVSAQAWKEWRDDMMIKVINEYRLNMAEEKDYKTLMDQMKAFLGLQSESKVLEVENAERGKDGVTKN